MGWQLLLVGLLSASLEALAALAPIQWAEFVDKKFVLAPKASAPYQRLRIWGQHDRPSFPDATPGAMLKPDGKIAMGTTDLCIEASGDDDGDAVRVNYCTGGPHQLWRLLPLDHGKQKKIQLKETRKCIELDVNTRHGLNGAPVELRECSDKVTQLWNIEGQAQSMWQNLAERSAPLSVMRDVICAFSMLGTLGLLSSTGLWWRRYKARKTGRRQRGAHLSLDPGGICLIPKNIPRMFPAAMVVAPTAAAEDEKVFDRFPRGAAVALGKFEALHRGHEHLATTAAKMGRSAWLMSFNGIREVLGKEPRLPIVAPELRSIVLESWGGIQEKSVNFADIRSLQPHEFVDLLANDLGVQAVVCGSNYRFGHRAAGDATLLKSLGEAAGLKVEVLDLLEQEILIDDSSQIVSSTEIRKSLAEGDVEIVASYLGRPHAVVWKSSAENALLDPSNQPPSDGIYQVELTAHPVGFNQQSSPVTKAALTIKDGAATLDAMPPNPNYPEGTLWSTKFVAIA